MSQTQEQKYTIIRIKKDHHTALKIIAAKKGVPMNTVVNEAIIRYLRQEKYEV